MMVIMLAPQPGRQGLEDITNAFVDSFDEHGYNRESEVAITEKIDPTVRFVGAPISVMKPYLVDRELPLPGVYMVQQCVRTQNVSGLFEPEGTPKYGSFFTAMGALTSSDRLAVMFSETSRYMSEVIGLDAEDTHISVYSEDKDLHEAAMANGFFEVNADTMEPPYYRHSYGMEGVFGRNTSYWVKNASTGEYEDIGNVIIIESKLGQLGVELALGDSTIMKQKAGLDHVLDSYRLGVVDETVPSPIRRRLEDCIITSLALRSEGLEPSARNNQTRILRSYHKGISLYRKLSGISLDTLVDQITEVESGYMPFDSVGSGQAIGKWVSSYEEQLAERKGGNTEDQKIVSLLGRYGA